MKNVLIISDNLYLCQASAKIFSKYNTSFIFDYGVSPFSNLNDFASQLDNKVQTFDLKDHNDVERITSTYNLVISLHCKQLFPEELFTQVKCINVHPGYNPINRGWYPQVFAIINDNKVGATIHEIDGEIDHGNIIDRGFVEKQITDTSKSLYDKILIKEMELLENNIEAILNNTYHTISPESEGELYLKKDFNNLRELDLNEKVSTLELINKLRALTHGDFKNAFFIDPQSGKKVYISVSLEFAQ